MSPVDTQGLAVLGVVVGLLAAVAALANALAAIVDTWRDARGLTITLRLKAKSDVNFTWTMRIWNRARTPNALADLELIVDAKKMQPPRIFSELEGGLLRQSLPSFSYHQADLAIRLGDEIPKAVWESAKRIEIRVHPVRGRCQRFRFRKQDLVRVS